MACSEVTPTGTLLPDLTVRLASSAVESVASWPDSSFSAPTRALSWPDSLAVPAAASSAARPAEFFCGSRASTRTFLPGPSTLATFAAEIIAPQLGRRASDSFAADALAAASTTGEDAIDPSTCGSSPPDAVARMLSMSRLESATQKSAFALPATTAFAVLEAASLATVTSTHLLSIECMALL